jgi:hypothetical protein
MNYIQIYERARRIFIAIACFSAALFLIYRAHNPGQAGTSLIVPLMCVLTGFTVAAMGLVTILRDANQTEA